MTGLFVLLSLAGWAAGAVALASTFRDLLANDPTLRLACQLRPHAVLLYLAMVTVVWPAAFIAKILSDLVNRSRT